ncbi:hypothetical protein Barb6XT_00693 [Bacteroidales bacterium Barb6XT]|nr:hypothetical protein Barb6XT_00693 [Bacteroidales bacterium Barb6XT]
MVMNKHYFVRNGCKVVCMYFSVMETVAKYFAGIFHHAKIVTKCFACISSCKNGCKVVCNHFPVRKPIAKCFAIIFRLIKLSKTAILAFHIADVYKS